MMSELEKLQRHAARINAQLVKADNNTLKYSSLTRDSALKWAKWSKRAKALVRRAEALTDKLAAMMKAERRRTTGGRRPGSGGAATPDPGPAAAPVNGS